MSILLLVARQIESGDFVIGFSFIKSYCEKYKCPPLVEFMDWRIVEKILWLQVLLTVFCVFNWSYVTEVPVALGDLSQ